METLGQRIRKIRCKKGLTRKELGEKLGFNNPDIRLWSYENDTAYPRQKMLERFASALNYLLTGKLDDTTIKNLYADGLIQKDTTNAKPHYYFQLFQLIMNNEELIKECLKTTDYEKIGTYIYEKILSKRGNLDKLNPFMSDADYRYFENDLSESNLNNSMSDEKAITQRIKSIRIKNNLSQAEFGKRLNMSQARIWQYESGERNPKFITILKIAETFHVSAYWILTGTNK